MVGTGSKSLSGRIRDQYGLDGCRRADEGGQPQENRVRDQVSPRGHDFHSRFPYVMGEIFRPCMIATKFAVSPILLGSRPTPPAVASANRRRNIVSACASSVSGQPDMPTTGRTTTPRRRRPQPDRPGERRIKLKPGLALRQRQGGEHGRRHQHHAHVRAPRSFARPRTDMADQRIDKPQIREEPEDRGDAARYHQAEETVNTPRPRSSAASEQEHRQIAPE